MKRIVCILLPVVLCCMMYGCKSDSNDLGKQTVINKNDGYTLVQEVLSFKYNDDEDELKEDENAKFSGFIVNAQSPMTLSTKKDAIAIAQKEFSATYNKINVYYDRTQGIWKVVFSNDTEDDSGNIQSSKVATVYIDEDGYTIAMTTSK